MKILFLGKTDVEEAASAMLYTCLKDYKEDEPMRLMSLNKVRMLRSALEERGISPKGPVAVKTAVQPINIHFTQRIDAGVRTEVIAGLKALQFFKMPYYLKDIDVTTSTGTYLNKNFTLQIWLSILFSDLRSLLPLFLKVYSCIFFIFCLSDSCDLPTRPKSKLCQGVDMIRRTMELQECGLYRGFIYRKIPEATKTYTYYKTVNDYVMSILDRPEVCKRVNVSMYVNVNQF